MLRKSVIHIVRVKTLKRVLAKVTLETPLGLVSNSLANITMFTAEGIPCSRVKTQRGNPRNPTAYPTKPAKIGATKSLKLTTMEVVLMDRSPFTPANWDPKTKRYIGAVAPAKRLAGLAIISGKLMFISLTAIPKARAYIEGIRKTCPNARFGSILLDAAR